MRTTNKKSFGAPMYAPSVTRGLLFLLIVLRPGVTNCDEKVLEQQFRSEGPKGWRVLQNAHKNLQGSAVFSDMTQVPGENKTSRSMRWDFKIRNGLLVFEEYNLDSREERGSGHVMGKNSKYFFYLGRKTSSSPWLLNHVAPEGSTERRDPWSVAEQGGVLQQLHASWAIGDLTLPELIKDQAFHIEHIAEIQHASSQCIELHFRYSNHKGEEGEDLRKRPSRSLLREGRLICDPSKYWAIQQLEFEFDGGVRAKGTVEYGEDPERIPIVRSYTRSVASPGGEQEVQVHFDRLSFRELPESDFTLSAYGLPEPTGVAPLGRSYAWLWIILAGVGFLALGVVFLKAAQHFRAKGALGEKT